MSFPRIAVALLLVIVSTSPIVGNNPAQILAAHPVWIPEDIKWEQDPGDKQRMWAAGSVLYFGENGEFGRFGGTLIKRGARLGLSDGEGEIVYTGAWTIKAEAIQVNYRLVGMYKVIRPAEEKPPEIPGPVQHAEILLDLKSPTHLDFNGKRYQATSRLKASELKQRLQTYSRTGGSEDTTPN
jgi:hypothetical protein